MKPFHTRFAPSPTGALHRGHIYAAQVAKHFAEDTGGQFRLRIDDIDHTRCKNKFTAAIYDDLKWLGLNWNGRVTFQSQRVGAYQAALKKLQALNILYPCFLSRRELAGILSAPHDSPLPTNIRNTDKLLSGREQKLRANDGKAAAWRLRMDHAKHLLKIDKLGWHDCLSGTHNINPDIFGDAVIARGDIGVSYHLAVVIDDALDQISLVTRGIDLAPSTHLHRLLQELLDLPTPTYLHHALVCDTNGKRLSKRNGAESIANLRSAGKRRTEIFDELPALPTPSQR